MKAKAIAATPREVELKLALMGQDASSLAARLAKLPLLARRQSTRQRLDNTYFDTPDLALQRQRITLRLRRVGSEARPLWLQTLKVGGSSDSALSRRAEWEAPVPQGSLSAEALRGTAWDKVDPDGSLFQSLQPVFRTAFERTAWLVRRRDRSVVELALDIGHIQSGEWRAPVCELELELKEGAPQALFDLAKQLAGHLPFLPENLSKSARGFALGAGQLNQARPAGVVALEGAGSVQEAASRVLSEMFGQFTANLNSLLVSDDAEVVHQARVGWRRFRSGLRLFGQVVETAALPPLQGLRPLVAALGELRDLDAARVDTLPRLAEAFVAGDSARAQAWTQMVNRLQEAAVVQRKSVRDALLAPSVTATLLAIVGWLEALHTPVGNGSAERPAAPSLKQWARLQVERLVERTKRARKDARSPAQLHRVRILAKRARYSIEALRDLLPRRAKLGAYRLATRLQARLGAARDILQACALAGKLEVDRGLHEYLRGFALANTAAITVTSAPDKIRRSRKAPGSPSRGSASHPNEGAAR